MCEIYVRLCRHTTVSKCINVCHVVWLYILLPIMYKNVLAITEGVVKGVSRLRVGSWNIGSLSGKSIELVKILKKMKISIACIQETRWVGSKARDVDGFKLWYSAVSRDRNGVGILVDQDLRGQVVGVNRVNDRLMAIKLIIEGLSYNVISAYAPQAGLDEATKKQF